MALYLIWVKKVRQNYKVSRNGLRVGDILSNFDEKYKIATDRHKEILKQHNFAYELEELEKAWFEGVECMKRFELIDSEHFVNGALKSGKKV